MTPIETLARWCDEVEEDHSMAEASCVECLSVWPCRTITPLLEACGIEVTR